ncbi:hypothetical protein EDD15DRAFT_2364392 [Pisolithus albus]|nr:hypothetical protein EDD15DRAFT_2364392 [Pisolithus albus]
MQRLPAGRRKASEAAAGNRPRSTRNPLPSIPETSVPTEPEDAQGDDSAVGVHSPRRRSQWSNAGTGGRLQQLEKVSQAIETPCRQREQVIDLPNDEPVNVMAPTPRRRRKNGGPKYRSQADSEGSTAVPASARHGQVVQPSQVSVQAEQDTRFGFQLGPPCRPTFVGPQSLDAFQGRQTNSAVTTNKGKGSHARHVVSGTDSQLVERLQHSPAHVPGSPLSVLSEMEDAEMEPEPQSSPRQSEEIPDNSRSMSKSPHRSTRSRSESEEPHQHVRVVKGKQKVTTPSDHVDDDIDHYNEDIGDRIDDDETPDWDSLGNDLAADRRRDCINGETPSEMSRRGSVQQSVPRRSFNAQQKTIQPMQAPAPNFSMPSGFQQPTIRPLRVPVSQKPTSTLSNQQLVPQKRGFSQVAPHAPSLQSRAPVGHPPPESPPLSAPSHSRSERLLHRVGEERAGISYDLLERHHITNSRRRSPSMNYLAGVPDVQSRQPSKKQCLDPPVQREDSTVDKGKDGEADDPKGDSAEDQPRRGGRFSKNAKGTIPVRPTLIAFYPPQWVKLLNLAKARMRLYVAVEDAFPRLEDAVGGQCREVLMEVIAHFEAQGWEVEAGYYPTHKLDMCRLLFNDMQTFRSDLKKAVMKSLRADYELYPPSTAKTEEERIAAVKKKADDLLSTGKYLHGEPDDQGRASNFAHRALKNITLAFYYANTSKCLRQFPEFQEYVPYKALALVTAMVHALLSLFRKHGIDKSAQVNSQDIKEGYIALNEAISNVLDHPHHGPKLNAMLVDWAQTGMTGYVTKHKPTERMTNEFAPILD